MIFDGFKNYPDTTTPLDATYLNELLNLLLPIGKVEVFFDNNDHSNHMGFTWERTSIGKVPVGININDTDFNVIGKTGGEKSHTLTVNEMPAHNHGIKAAVLGANGNAEYAVSNFTSSINNSYIQNTGGSQAHNNLQPYEVMAFWKRVE